MREISKRVVLLSDYESLQVALDYSSRYGSPDGKTLKSPIQQMNTVHHELLKYLQNQSHPRPCSQQSPEGITAFLTALQDAGYSPPASAGPRREEALAAHHLTKSERLMLVNSAPTTQVFLSTLVEECFARFTPEQIEHILELVRTHLLPAQANGTAEEYEEQEGEEGEEGDDMIDEDAYLNA
ncbi:hypothetical protein OC842_004793 [Tilletia horrida]|uniref:DNA-directed RNA polymerase III subunit RPC9 n=1 Tax=Tilletia horrida TaxID=155126 RepID=A0AAN6G971_9BASI|nr:hypothetical protein OC842_004793 [Tilletia horrida]